MAMFPAMITTSSHDPEPLARFWMAAAGMREVWRWEDRFTVLANESHLRLGIQRVEDPEGQGNRVHLDWECSEYEPELDRLTRLGAVPVAQHEMGPFAWTVLTDPQGNMFCLSRPPGS